MFFRMHLRMNFGWIVLMIMVNNGVQAWTYHYNTNKKMEWEMARKWCRQHFTDMVAIQNKEEVKYLNQILPYHNSYYWIGLRKIAGQWTWVGTMKPLSPKAANWARNEPNDKGANEDCVEIYIKRPEDSGMWNDDKCSKEKTALCYTASCFERSCSEHAECVENIGNYTCKCNAGFTGPRCNEAVKCGMVKNPEHGFVQCNHVYGDFRFNSSCHFHCARGYIIQGSQNLHCLSSGKWDSDPPQCQVVECPPITTRTSGWNMTCRHPLHINSYNSTCVFSCEEGFELRGSKTTQCDHTGKWTHNTPTCTAVTCKPLVSPQKGNMTCTDPLGNFSYRSSCAVSCEEGYTLRGENTLACLETGKWSAETPSCEAVTCDPLVRPQRGHITCTDPLGNFLFSSLCAVICEEGYTLRGENTLTCLKNGNWSAETPSCEAVTCNPPVRPQKGNLTCKNPLGNFSFRSSCAVSCEEGYTLRGENTLTCLKTGKWSAETPSCEVIRCNALVSVHRGSMRCTDLLEKFAYGSVCQFECDVGFFMMGSNHTHCSSEGKWTHHPPVCQVVQCPRLPAQFGDGKMNCIHPLSTNSYNSTCVFNCDEGYKLIGSYKTQCDYTGQWTPKCPTCKAVTCDQIVTPTNSHMTCIDPLGNFSFRSSCAVSCEEGYTLRGENTLTCLKTGKWSAETPSCEAVTCDQIVIPVNSQMTCIDPLGNFSFRSSCAVSCEEGYTLRGENTLTCLKTGKWSAETPSCEVIRCNALGSVHRGSMHCTDFLEKFAYGSVCQFECDVGFFLMGSNHTHCSSEGRWTHNPPVCQVVQCPRLPAQFGDGKMNCIHPLSTNSYNSTCVFNCDEGYKLIGSYKTQCDYTGQWTPRCPTCKAVTCDQIVTPTNSHMTCIDPLGNFSFRSSCAVSCEEGYTLRGENTLTCLKTGKWSAETPSCKARQCPLLSSPEKGWMNCSHPHSPFSYGSHCSFGCEIGYMLREESQLDCTSAGTWNQETPSCQVVQCESLFPAPLSQSDTNPVPFINCSHPRGNFSFGSVCVFRCPEGYRLNGTTDLICTSTGLWTDLLPTCIIQSMTLGTGFLVYGAIGAASALGLLLMVGVVMLVMRQFSKDKFTPDYSAWDGALNPVFEANEPF